MKRGDLQIKAKAEQPPAPPSEKQIEIKGDELGEYKDTKELRQKAVEYYKKNLAGTYVNHNKIGKIIFTLSGYKKPISFSADKRKLLLFPYLPEIIKNGVVQNQDDYRNRSNILNIFILKSVINIYDKEEKEEKEETVRVIIRTDNNGNLYYDHAIQIGAFKKTLTGNKSGGLKNSALNIEEEAFVVNLFIKDKNGDFI